MAITTALRPVTHITDESSTLRRPPPPTRPSLDSSSIKSRKSLLSSFLNVGRGVGKPVTSGSKLKLESKPVEIATQTPADAKNDVHANRSTLPVKQNTDDTQLVTKNPPFQQQRPRSKSRTILRAISTTFRSRSPVSPASHPPPASAPLSPQARQNREAALRERGLLPPKDLSQQEAEQDRHLPVIVPSDHHDVVASSSPSSSAAGGGGAEESRGAQSPSAADLVKREWVSKNSVLTPAANADAAVAATPSPRKSLDAEERERLNAFKFGGGRSPALTASSQPESVVEVITPTHSGAKDEKPPALPEKDLHRKFSQGSSSHGVSSQNTGRPSPVPSSPPNTPSKLTHRRNDSSDSATKPTLGETESVTTTSSSQTRPISIPRKLSSGTSQPPSHNASPPPVISLTPPRTVVSGEPMTSVAPLFPHSRRSSSLKQMPSISESVTSSVITPSLDTSSRTTATTSTLHTSESSNNNNTTACSGASSNSGKGKVGMLKVKTHHHDHPAMNIPTMIVESPIEDRYKPRDALKTEHEAVIPEVDEENHHLPATPGSLTVPQPYSDPIPAQISIEQQRVGRRGRGYTDPGKMGHRRSFLNPFKRAQSPEPPPLSSSVTTATSNTKTNEPGTPVKKRLSVSASLSNLRRAASGLSFASSSSSSGIKSQRPKSTYDPMGGGGGGGGGGGSSSISAPVPLRSPGGRRGGGFDASHLPPSPTLPNDLAAEAGRTTGAGPRVVRRKPTNPTLHSRGSILIEASAIEDDEVRRVTELAFLG